MGLFGYSPSQSKLPVSKGNCPPNFFTALLSTQKKTCQAIGLKRGGKDVVQLRFSSLYSMNPRRKSIKYSLFSASLVVPIPTPSSNKGDEMIIANGGGFVKVNLYGLPPVAS
jgi:hypothetical protein